MGRIVCVCLVLLVSCTPSRSVSEQLEAEILLTGSCPVLERLVGETADAFESGDVTAQEGTDLFWLISLAAFQIGTLMTEEGLVGPTVEHCFFLSESVSEALIRNAPGSDE